MITKKRGRAPPHARPLNSRLPAVTIGKIIRLAKIYLTNLHVEIEKSILADVTNTLYKLLTEMTWTYMAKPVSNLIFKSSNKRDFLISCSTSCHN